MTSIVNAAADFSDSLDFLLPVAEAEYFNIFRGAGSVLTRNLVPGRPGASMGGTVVAQGDYGQFSGPTGYLQTAVAEVEAMTFVVAARPSTSGDLMGTGRAVLLGNYDGASVASTNLLVGSATTMAANACWDDGGVVREVADLTQTVGGWELFALRTDATTVRIDNLTLSTAETNTPASGTRTIGANLLRVGWGYSNTAAGASDILMAAVYARRLSEEDLARIAVNTRAVATASGLTI